MRIAHNLSSLNTARLIGISEKKLGNAIEKLSSGYRINSASDDAAGLSISEKMRGQIRGLRQAARNAQDGISVIQTAEGALNEIHNILQRIHELSIQAANDTDTPDDRGKIQKEINELVKEVDNISNNTEFNTKKLLDGTLAPKTAKINPALSSRAAVRVTPEATSDMVSGNLKLIYMEQTDSFETVRSDDGNATIPGNSYLKNVLQTEIVPQAVKSILSAFSPAFNYLSSSTIGIGLNLYSDSSSSVLASAKVAYGISGNRVESTMLEYQLAVNMSSLAFDADGKLTGESRNALETTIIHEMVHTFMDEALTNGMIGVSNGVVNSSNSFPGWFKEGMAQAVAGGYANCNDWVNGSGGLGITTDTSKANISAKVASNSFSLKSGTAASMYATGYLACMYLGYLASGSTSVTAADISKGLGRILCDLVGGKSLDTVINERTGGKYSSISDIEGKFGNQDSSSFIYALTQAAGSSGNGGLAAGSLTAGDLLPDSPASISLFELDITNDIIKNIYPSGVNVLSGGGKSSQGDAPVSNYASTIGEGSEAAANTGTTIDLSNISSAAGVYYDSSQKILMITGSGDYTLKGASSAGVRVMVTNGVNANITLDNAKINTSAGSGISLEGNARVTLNLIGNNSVISSTQRMAGIRVTTGAALNINGNGTLEVENNDSSTANGAGIGGAFGESGGNIVIDGGNITVKGTAAGAGIGGGLFGSGGDITINGGNISVVYAQAGSTVCSGAGIGGGFWGDGGKITITGGTVNSTSSRSGAGIGGGNHSSGGTIEVTGGTINAGGATGIGGGDGGTAGDIKITGGTVTAKGSNGGAGIGSGSGNNGGSIIIDGSGVIIKATGSGSSANIGGGANSPVSSGTVAKNSGIVFEGANGTVYGNTTVGTPLDCEGKPLTVLGGSTLTVSNGGKIINQGIITNSGCIENHGVIGTVTGTGITHNYVTGITRQIKEPDTAVVGESLASSIAGLSPSRITVSYNGTTRTLAGVWSVTDLDGHPVTDLAGTIVREGDSYIYSVSFTSEDNIYFDPLNMSFYEMQGNGAEKSKYGMVTDKYVSASGPQGGGSTLTYSFVVNSAAKGEPPPEEPPKNPPGTD